MINDHFFASDTITTTASATNSSAAVLRKAVSNSEGHKAPIQRLSLTSGGNSPLMGKNSRLRGLHVFIKLP